MQRVKLFAKSIIKQLFFTLKMEKVLDKAIYISTYLKNYSQNKSFKKNNKELKLPPEYYLYETYKLNYRAYIEDGKEVADEIAKWTAPYLPKSGFNNVLDWGCGLSRICRHLSEYLGKNSKVFGCDINEDMIEWNVNNLSEIDYTLIDYMPPTPYNSVFFDMIYGISIITHIEAENQIKWFNEIHRILKPGGVFLFTSHGTNCFENLLANEREELDKKGVFTKLYPQKGHRLMATYNKTENIIEMICNKFEVAEFYEKEEAIKKTGKQDLWILKKL